MPFAKGDININRNGRGTGKDLVNPKSVSGVSLRDNEFKQILRRMKPLTKKAIVKLETLIDDNGTSEGTRMRAIAFVITEYEKLMNEVYKPDKGKDSEDGYEEKEEAPLIAFKMLNGGKQS